MIKKYLFAILLFLPMVVSATHYRAGEILYKLVAPLTYEVTVVTYTKTSGSSGGADRDTVEILWGDGLTDLLVRTNGPLGSSGVPNGEILFTDIKKNEYKGVHQYAGIRPFYLISVLDLNRISDIININGGTSVNVPFYIEDSLKFYDIASLGYNNSPVLLNPPIDFANVNDTFYHNPNAYDSEGDSLYFTLIPPKQSSFSNVPSYQYPNQIIPGANNKFTINSRTGELIWATPQQEGIYNIAILIREYRNRVFLGTLLRDMQIIVLNCPNDPPNIDDVRDTCVIAGSYINIPVRASDLNLPQQVSLTASGAPFIVSVSPATFDSMYGNPVTSNFGWQTQCEHIRSQFYTVVIRAKDNNICSLPGVGLTTTPLVDLETWLIRVIAPPPINLTATPFNSAITLTWDNPYRCASVPNFRGFSVWRRIGSNSFTPDSCETGLAGRGYVKIADDLVDYRYVDADVVHGQIYCYRIVANFSQLSPNGLVEYDNAESIPSNEACAELKRDVPVLTHVDVTNTDAATGSIFIDWVNPNVTALDTTQHPGPYKYELYRSSGFIGSSPFNLIQTYNSISYTGLLSDTFYNDVGLDTKSTPYTYKIVLKAQTDSIVGPTDAASSIFLSIASSDQSLLLSWQEQVPWINNYYFIYKQNRITSVYELLDSTILKNYADTGLLNDTLYCYYVMSKGSYTGTNYPDPLYNKSQEVCERPRDTIPPCAPPLTITNECDLIENSEWDKTHWKNYLHWQVSSSDCGGDIVRYKIYFKAPLTKDFVLLDSSLGKNDTSYTHDLSLSTTGIAGCYRLTAVDNAGNETDSVFTVCTDNCPLYELPNVFTPNGDGANELFIPFPYRFIGSIDMTITDRWGNVVFTTQNPDILWDGKDMKTGKPVAEGVYFYSGKYYEETLIGKVERPLPPGKNGGGFIHLMRNK